MMTEKETAAEKIISDAMANPSPAKSMGDPGITPLSPSHTQQNDTDQVPPGPSFVVVVAIDFGTTSSGYAYAFTKEPECIHTMSAITETWVAAAPVFALPSFPSGQRSLLSPSLWDSRLAGLHCLSQSNQFHISSHSLCWCKKAQVLVTRVQH
ncbi:Heat shock 70 kDa protein 12A [Collichthys lucidus]|uniref:Heat shock 70 kDa protein 12A n=1 Tax=Collichthys lucidus TaxID=240159 RepID=A0A4V6ARP0_COLLU|nr:Heat shock 70 kDa protein 12A [Collichthys lucidus]